MSEQESFKNEEEKKVKKPMDPNLVKGILACIGGFLWQFYLGAIFMWGNIAPYVTSYLRLADESVTTASTFFVLPIQILVGGSFMYLGTSISLKMHPRITMALALAISLVGLGVSSIVTDYYAFIIFYGVFFGLAYSLSYATPLVVAWSYFKGNKGRVSGIVTAGFGMSAAVFNIITLKLVNPDNLLPDITITEDAVVNHYYSASIADNTPAMLQYVGIILLFLGVIAIALMPNFGPNMKTKSETYNPDSLKDIFAERTIYILIVAAFLAASCAVYFLSAFKIYGLDNGHDDQFLSVIGLVANAINGPCRFLWAQAVDLITFKATVTILFCLQVVLVCSVNFIAEIPALYMIWVCIIMACQGGTMAIFAAVSAQLYGPNWGGKIVSIFIAMFGFAGVIIGLIQEGLISQFGYLNLMLLLGAFSLVGACIILFGFKEDNHWTRRKRTMTANSEALLAQEEQEEQEDKED